MNKIFFLILTLLLPNQLLAASYAAIVKDFSQPPMGKSFQIKHPDGSTDALQYPETPLRDGDSILFPEGLKSTSSASVDVLVGGKIIKLRVQDSPWSLPSGEQDASESISSTATALFASIFSGESRARYSQGMSKGHVKQKPLILPFSLVNQIQLLSADKQLHNWFWTGGEWPFSLEVVVDGKSRTIADYDAKNEIINGHRVRVAILPTEAGQSGRVHYVLRDKNGSEVAFDVVYTQQVDSLNQMLADLDNQLLVDGSKASRRLMLWNATAALSDTSSRRAMLRWMLLNSEDTRRSQ